MHEYKEGKFDSWEQAIAAGLNNARRKKGEHVPPKG
jgi:hypothetical protein